MNLRFTLLELDNFEAQRRLINASAGSTCSAQPTFPKTFLPWHTRLQQGEMQRGQAGRHESKPAFPAGCFAQRQDVVTPGRGTLDSASSVTSWRKALNSGPAVFLVANTKRGLRRSSRGTKLAGLPSERRKWSPSQCLGQSKSARPDLNQCQGLAPRALSRLTFNAEILLLRVTNLAVCSVLVYSLASS